MSTPREYCEEHAVTNRQKWGISLFGGALFAVVGAPVTYKLTNAVVDKVAGKSTVAESGGPSMLGLALHAAVYALITRAAMEV
jgi:anti-sigma factor RsiW